jgi:hypothetical protein
MTPELAAAIRTEIAKLADRINDLTAERTALVKLLANGAEVPTVEAHEPPTIAFAANPRARKRRVHTGPTLRNMLRHLVVEAGKDGIAREALVEALGKRTNSPATSIGSTVSYLKTKGEIKETKEGVIKSA